MLGFLSKKINAIKSIYAKNSGSNNVSENNAYWQMCNENDFPDRISVKLEVVFEKEMRASEPLIDTVNKDVHDFVVCRFTKYLYEIKDAVIDPDENLVILAPNYLFRRAHPLMEDPYGPIQTRPSKAGFLSLSRKNLQIDSAIIIKFDWTNYYHFIIDTIPQIEMCDELGIPADVPIIVPKNFDKLAFVRDYFREIKPLKRKLIVQEDDLYIEVKKLYVAKDVFFSPHVFNISRDTKRDPAISAPSKIFIKRHKSVGRTLSNLEEIEDILKSRGFTVIEPGDYTFPQQISLFTNAEVIIGIHGAGLTNMIFSRVPNMKLIEILKAAEEFPDHFKNIAREFSFRYSLVAGEPQDDNIANANSFGKGNFHLNKEALIRELDS